MFTRFFQSTMEAFSMKSFNDEFLASKKWEQEKKNMVLSQRLVFKLNSFAVQSLTSPWFGAKPCENDHLEPNHVNPSPSNRRFWIQLGTRRKPCNLTPEMKNALPATKHPCSQTIFVERFDSMFSIQGYCCHTCNTGKSNWRQISDPFYPWFFSPVDGSQDLLTIWRKGTGANCPAMPTFDRNHGGWLLAIKMMKWGVDGVDHPKRFSENWNANTLGRSPAKEGKEGKLRNHIFVLQVDGGGSKLGGSQNPKRIISNFTSSWIWGANPTSKYKRIICCLGVCPSKLTMKKNKWHKWP